MSMRIGGNEENPFLKRMSEEGIGQAGGINADIKAPDGGIAPKEKTGETEGVKSAGMEEGAAGANANPNPNSIIDRSQFTKDDDLQEIDLQNFEDDFE